MKLEQIYKQFKPSTPVREYPTELEDECQFSETKNHITTREIAVLRKNNLTYQEIGDKVGLTKQAVHIRLKNIGENGLRPIWSSGYPCCIDCGTTSRGHKSNGRCSPCSQNHKYATDPKFRNKIIKNNLKRYHKNKKTNLE